MGRPSRRPSPSRADRIAGCLLAGAAGDALGAAVEFVTLDSIRRRYGPGGVRDFAPMYGRTGAITDDTQMTLFTAEGLLRARTRHEEGGAEESVDPRPVVWRAYQRWLETQGPPAAGPTGERGWLMDVPALNARRSPGNTCLSALASGVMATRDRRINDSKGCGGVMRAAPAGLVGADDPFALGADLAALTHSHPAGFLSAGFLAFLIDRILRGDGLAAAVDAAMARLAAEPEHEETLVAVRRAVDKAAGATSDAAADAASRARAGVPSVEGDGPSAEAVERLGGGWVGEEALAIAVYCAMAHPDNLEAAVILAANHSGDSDSTAAITGNIMGALHGPTAVPERWLSGLELRDEIATVAADLAVGYDPSPDWRRRYPP